PPWPAPWPGHHSRAPRVFSQPYSSRNGGGLLPATSLPIISSWTAPRPAPPSPPPDGILSAFGGPAKHTALVDEHGAHPAIVTTPQGCFPSLALVAPR